ncbi:MAG: alpha/beta fold hydrolase [Gammaproteobacteria bacterium]|nr:alpha/beta fold hydrolase [Gammaproteobacteria bacterium]
MRHFHFIVGALTFFISTGLQANVLVLVHGYLASPSSWEQSGINVTLEAQGWKRGGLFSNTPAGVQLYEADNKADNTVYVVDLPAEAPVIVQSDFLLGMLNTIRQKRPDEPLIIVGHSAGGVVARMSLIRGGAKNVAALITIASPHVGTTRANEALDATNESGPFGIVKNLFGGSDYDTLKRSRGLLFDLTQPYPGNMLYWLNNQKHPDIKYISVVRLNPVGFAGDDLVPGYSQDMNNVTALQGRSTVITTPAGHTLVAQDANTIVSVLKSIKTD